MRSLGYCHHRYQVRDGDHEPCGTDCCLHHHDGKTGERTAVVVKVLLLSTVLAKNNVLSLESLESLSLLHDDTDSFLILFRLENDLGKKLHVLQCKRRLQEQPKRIQGAS